MDILLKLTEILIGAILLTFIAAPQLVAKQSKPKKKFVGATYWGIYEDQNVEEEQSMKQIELPKTRLSANAAPGMPIYDRAGHSSATAKGHNASSSLSSESTGGDSDFT